MPKIILPKKISPKEEILSQIFLGLIESQSRESPIKIASIKAGCFKPIGGKTTLCLKIEGTSIRDENISVFHRTNLALWEIENPPSEEVLLRDKKSGKGTRLFVSRTGMNKIQGWIENQPEVKGEFTLFFRYIE